MSTDAHGAAPVWAGAVRVGGLVGSALGARPWAEVTLRRLRAVVLAIAGLIYLHPLPNSDKDYFTHVAPF
jgi:hypothetical protein